MAAQFSLTSLVIGLVITAVVALFVWVALGMTEVRWQRPATGAVLIVGALLSLLAAL